MDIKYETSGGADNFHEGTEDECAGEARSDIIEAPRRESSCQQVTVVTFSLKMRTIHQK